MSTELPTKFNEGVKKLVDKIEQDESISNEEDELSIQALEAGYIQQINQQQQEIAYYQDQIQTLQDETLYENQEKKRGFFLSSLSIDEQRISALILCLIACMIFGGVNYIMLGDISANLTNIITALIYSIAGVNITNSVLSRFGNGSNNSESNVNIQTNSTIRPIGSPAQPVNPQNMNQNMNMKAPNMPNMNMNMNANVNQQKKMPTNTMGNQQVNTSKMIQK